jgi:cytochrome c oxidase subunit II
LNETNIGNLRFHAAKGLMYPLPAPGSVPKKAPIPWDPTAPDKGLGYRSIEVDADKGAYNITEYPVPSEIKTGQEQSPKSGQVIKITAKKFEYSPSQITIKKGVATVLEFTSLDTAHGFNCPDLKVRTDINPGSATRLTITPQKSGVYDFHCDVFCGDGHDGMSGKIIVVD